MSIYIYTHKDFECPVKNPDYKILTENKLNNSYELDVIDVTQNNSSYRFGSAYSEVKGLYWLYENNINDSYIGLNHYRRYFDFLDDTSNIEWFLSKESSIILPQPENLGNIINQYARYHFDRDIIDMLRIINTIFPEYKDVVHDIIYTEMPFFIANLFVMKKEDFMDYMKWLDAILKYFNFKNKFENYEDVKNEIIKRSPENISYNFISFQSRLQGFLTERLFTLYVHRNFRNKILYALRKY